MGIGRKETGVPFLKGPFCLRTPMLVLQPRDSPCSVLHPHLNSPRLSSHLLCCYCWVTKFCLWNPMDCIIPGFPVLHYLPGFALTRVHWVGDAIQPSHPLLSPSPPAPNLSQHEGLFQWVSSSHQWPKYWSFSFSIRPSNEYSGVISFRINWFDFLAVQGTLKSLLQHHNSLKSCKKVHSKFTTPRKLIYVQKMFLSKGLSRVFFSTTIQKHHSNQERKYRVNWHHLETLSMYRRCSHTKPLTSLLACHVPTAMLRVGRVTGVWVPPFRLSVQEAEMSSNNP